MFRHESDRDLAFHHLDGGVIRSRTATGIRQSGGWKSQDVRAILAALSARMEVAQSIDVGEPTLRAGRNPLVAGGGLIPVEVE